MRTELLESEVAYTAGLFDGEGTVAIYETTVGKRQGNPRPAFIYQVQIANTNFAVIRWLLDRIGGTYARKSQGKAHWRRGFVWRLTGGHASEFMQAIRPYCIIKTPEIDTALEFRGMLTPRHIRQTESMLSARRQLVAKLKEQKRAQQIG